MAANPPPQAPQQPQPYVIVAGNDLAVADIAEGDIIVQSLAWIGFMMLSANLLSLKHLVILMIFGQRMRTMSMPWSNT